MGESPDGHDDHGEPASVVWLDEERASREREKRELLAQVLKDVPTVEDALRSWAAGAARLPELERQLAREDKIKVLSELGHRGPAKLVDAALAECYAKNGRDNASAPLSDPQPWPEPVDGTDLLRELAAAVRRYVAVSEEVSTAVILWVVLAHSFEVFFVFPMLGLASPVKRSGKTLLLSVIAALVPRALYASNITAAALFRAVEKYRPTLLIDEADTFMRDNPELNGILNSGHTRSSAFVIRTVGDEHEPKRFSTFCPKAYAGIDRQKDTLEDRSIILPMRRRSPQEQVERLRLDRLAELEPLRRRAARWADDHLAELGGADPLIPDLGSDRAADNWRPLLAIADAVGGEWPERARRAAVGLTHSGDDAGNVRVLLLADLRDLFVRHETERLTSHDIVEELHTLEERPWPEWKGKPITAQQVAVLLKPFGIKPKTVRVGGNTPRCYERAQFADAFTRYLPVAATTSATCLQNDAFESATSVSSVAPQKEVVCRDVLPVLDGEPWTEEL